MSARGGALDGARVVPVVTVRRVEDAVPLAGALAAGGLRVVEVVLRSPVALDAVRRVRAELPSVRCGVGTLLRPSDVTAAVDAGAQFLVSPGTPEPLLAAMLDSGVPAVPGAMTPTEALRLAAAGVEVAKFFPAEAAGGARALAALAGPVPGLSFCATGGVTPASAPSYLALPTVAAVGGSWMLPEQVVAAGDWDRVTELAREAAAL